MLVTLGLSVLMLLGLDTLVKATENCIPEILKCTRHMAKNVSAVKNRTLLCGVMDDFFDCIEDNCNASLTSCEMDTARTEIFYSMKDHGCESYMPVMDDNCNFSPSLMSSQTTLNLIISLVVVFFFSIYSHRSTPR